MNRDEILRAFEAWLDGVLAREEPPTGIDADILSALAPEHVRADITSDQHHHAYGLWAAMTTLTHEVKLQGRAFKELNSTLGAHAGRIADEMRAVYREREREVRRDVERQSQRQLLAAMVDLRERLGRGLQSVREAEITSERSAARPWLARFARQPRAGVPEMLAALTRGYELAMEHLDQTLDDFHVHRIRCEGQPFDPRRMNAVDKEVSSAVPEGTVLDVYKSGYEWNGEVFRPAQVKVACAPAVETDA